MPPQETNSIFTLLLQTTHGIFGSTNFVSVPSFYLTSTLRKKIFADLNFGGEKISQFFLKKEPI